MNYRMMPQQKLLQHNSLSLWAQEIRIVILGVVFLIRHLLLNDTDQKYGRKIFERKSSETQQDTDTQEVTEPLSEEETNSSRDDQTEG